VPSSHAALPYASRITGTGSAFPEKIVTNDDLAKIVDTNDEWIRTRTGIQQRRVARAGDPDERNSSFGVKAALKALEMAGKTPMDLDQIIYATCTPDTLLPATACWLQAKIGARKAFAMDVNAACSGFLYALSTADQYIQTGKSRTVLVIGAEVLSRFLNWKDRTSCVLFGDGAGAAIVERCETTSPRRILSSHMRSDGTLAELIWMPAGGSNIEVTPEVSATGLDKIHLKGPEVFKLAVKILSDFALDALTANGMTPADLDWFIPHQANIRIIEGVADRLKLPMSKVLVNIERYGNTSSATIPTMLDEAVRDGRVKPGQLLLLDVFGAGLTYGSMLLRF